MVQERTEQEAMLLDKYSQIEQFEKQRDALDALRVSLIRTNLQSVGPPLMLYSHVLLVLWVEMRSEDQ